MIYIIHIDFFGTKCYNRNNALYGLCGKFNKRQRHLAKLTSLLNYIKVIGMNFFDFDFIITQIVLACKVPAGTGDAVHNSRPSYGIALNISGNKKYIFSTGLQLTAKENNIIFLPKKSDYIVEAIQPGDCYAINFMINKPLFFEPFVISLKNSTKMLQCFMSAEKHFRRKNSGYKLKCMSELYSILHSLNEEHNLMYASGSQKKQIAPAIDYIHDFYSEKQINTEFLSGLCGIKESYFRRVFLSCYGISPIKYINQLKLSRAKELLSQNEYTIETISQMSGFNNVYYFCRYFKKEIGITPSEYRKEAISD